MAPEELRQGACCTEQQPLRRAQSLRCPTYRHPGRLGTAWCVRPRPGAAGTEAHTHRLDAAHVNAPSRDMPPNEIGLSGDPATPASEAHTAHGLDAAKLAVAGSCAPFMAHPQTVALLVGSWVFPGVLSLLCVTPTNKHVMECSNVCACSVAVCPGLGCEAWCTVVPCLRVCAWGCHGGVVHRCCQPLRPDPCPCWQHSINTQREAAAGSCLLDQVYLVPPLLSSDHKKGQSVDASCICVV